MLSTEESLDRMAKARGMRWYDHVSRKDENVIKALKFEAQGSRKRGRNLEKNK